MDVTFPPMEYYEGNSSEPIGFDVAVIKAVAEAWGLSPVYKDTAFEGLLPALSAGRCDVAWSSMYITPERTAAYPAVQYATGRTTVIVPEGNPAGVSSVADLSGKTLVAQTGTSLMEEAEAIAKELKAEGKAPPTIQQYGKATDLIQQLIVGRADAGMTINSEAEFRISRSQGQIEIGFETGSEQKIGIYFPPDNAQLGETLRTALLALEKEGTLEQIAEEEAFPTNAVKVGPIVGLH
jgi:polar amino acid transport system substrate-binding protein